MDVVLVERGIAEAEFGIADVEAIEIVQNELGGRSCEVERFVVLKGVEVVEERVRDKGDVDNRRGPRREASR